MSKQPFIIFDLDGTCICSKHRQATLEDGSLDLAHWFENNTPEKIARDSLLPLAELFKQRLFDSFVIICTARQMTQADYDFLEAHGLVANHVIHRPHGNSEPDAELKVRQLTEFFRNVWNMELYQADAVMFDDNLNVLKAVSDAGITCFDATPLNKYGLKRGMF